MNSPNLFPLTYQKILFSKLVVTPLAVVIGFAGGATCAGQVWLKSGFELTPVEIVITPPPPNATCCFFDTSLSGAEKFSKELRIQMLAAHTSQYSDAILSKTIEVARLKDEARDNYKLQLLAATPQRFAVMAMRRFDTKPSYYTLITEQGYFYLHTIPKRRHEKYDSLVSARLGYSN